MSDEHGWDDFLERSDRDIGAAWAPTKDPDCPRTLVGTVSHYQQVEIDTQYGKARPWVCTIRARDGQLWAVWLWQTVLENEYERWRPMPGERIAIRYKGLHDRAPSNGGPYHKFTLTVDRGDRGLPGFLTDDPQLAGGEDPPASDGDPPVDADVVEEENEQKGADDDIGF
jgi:hypothetical protein